MLTKPDHIGKLQLTGSLYSQDIVNVFDINKPTIDGGVTIENPFHEIDHSFGFNIRSENQDTHNLVVLVLKINAIHEVWKEPKLGQVADGSTLTCIIVF